MQKYRLEGRTLNADDILQTVADELKISRRDVDDIYNTNRQFIKNLPKGNPENVTHALIHGQMPFIRLYGRAILKD